MDRQLETHQRIFDSSYDGIVTYDGIPRTMISLIHRMQKDNCSLSDTLVYSSQTILKNLLNFIKDNLLLSTSLAIKVISLFWLSWCVYFLVSETEAEEILSKTAGLSLPRKIKSYFTLSLIWSDLLIDIPWRARY